MYFRKLRRKEAQSKLFKEPIEYLDLSSLKPRRQRRVNNPDDSLIQPDFEYGQIVANAMRRRAERGSRIIASYQDINYQRVIDSLFEGVAIDGADLLRNLLSDEQSQISPVDSVSIY